MFEKAEQEYKALRQLALRNEFAKLALPMVPPKPETLQGQAEFIALSPEPSTLSKVDSKSLAVEPQGMHTGRVGSPKPNEP